MQPGAVARSRQDDRKLFDEDDGEEVLMLYISEIPQPEKVERYLI